MKVRNSIKLKKIAVAALIIPTLFLNNCKKSNTGSSDEKRGSVLKPVSLVATFTVGKPTADSKGLKSGDVLESEPKIIVPNSSLLDLQINQFETGIILRIKGGSEVFLHTREKGGHKELLCFVKKGTVLLSINKLNKSESVIVYSPTSRSEVRGTQFKIAVKEDGSKSSVAVSEGSVEVAFSNPSLESVYSSDSVPEKTKAQIGKLLNNTVVVEAGKEATLAKTDFNQILDKDPELKALLDNPVLNRTIDPAQTTQSQELDKVLTEIETKLAISIPEEKKDAAIPLADNKEKDAIKKESSEIAIIDLKEKSKTEIAKLVSENIAQKHNIYMKSVETTLGKRLETIKLTNGKIISGVIFMQGETYHVTDPGGEKTYEDSEVEEYSVQ